MKINQIEKNVPLPKKLRVGRFPKFPFREMETGDSFFIDLKDDTEKHAARDNIRSAASYYGKRNNVKFAIKADPEGIRIWRIS